VADLVALLGAPADEEDVGVDGAAAVVGLDVVLAAAAEDAVGLGRRLA
jgi:hypothetical protein